MEFSAFMDKSVTPTDSDLQKTLDQSHLLWKEVRDKVLEKKSELASARVYAEGRGIRIPVSDRNSLEDIFSLLEIKLAY